MALIRHRIDCFLISNMKSKCLAIFKPSYLDKRQKYYYLLEKLLVIIYMTLYKVTLTIQ